MEKSNVKLKILYIMKILMEKTDEKHTMSTHQLINELLYYGIKAERKSVYSDIELLIFYGIDIICVKGRSNNYFVASREFEIPELRLLVDAVLSSKFISHHKSRLLIRKIEKLTSVHEAKRIHSGIMIDSQVKNSNEEIYYNVDKIQDAIRDNKKIQFKYFDYTVDKSIQFRRDGDWYEVSPYALTWSEDHYYMIAYYEFYGTISNFRVDRMSTIELIEERRVLLPKTKAFDIAEYKKKNFRMYNGEPTKVKIRFENGLINSVFDRFGKDILIIKESEHFFSINIEVVPSHTFFSWLFMFGDKVKILGPQEVVQSMAKMLNQVSKLYEH